MRLFLSGVSACVFSASAFLVVVPSSLTNKQRCEIYILLKNNFLSEKRPFLLTNDDPGPEVFRLYLIKPSHYDDDGYVIQWFRSDIPSNTLAALNGLALDCRERRVLGNQVDIVISAIDEANCRIKPQRIIREISSSGGKGLVALVGVQSNQFPRSVDLARPLRAAGVTVCIGGFHVSGSLAMLPSMPPEIMEALELGISIFAGEAEEHFERVIRDAYRGTLAAVYNVLSSPPDLAGAVSPVVTETSTRGSMTVRASFDAGRGCPFQCSFCTIINVHGRKSRFRTADDVESIIRLHYAKGMKKFFITDDNFARNQNWEAIFDRIIRLRQREGLKLKFIIQVDTLCHKIPNFVTKAGEAGVNRVFIGLETLNSANLASAKKAQNTISEYRAMLQAWKTVGAITSCGYIIGFPNDTKESVLREIETMKRELPVDLVEFFCLMPLPGSEDHRDLLAKDVWMDADLNRYDSEHVTTAHPLMSGQEWREAYLRAWDTFYTKEHVETLMRRAAACGIKTQKIMKLAFISHATQAIEAVHPLQGGLLRRKHRRDRRPSRPIENPLLFYPRYAWECLSKSARLWSLYRSYKRLRSRVENDPAKSIYVDPALLPALEGEVQAPEQFLPLEKEQ
jgi:hypothetical protein